MENKIFRQKETSNFTVNFQRINLASTRFNSLFFLISGSTIKGVVAILNCILARQLCFEDPSCSAILEIIPRVCGPIPGK